MSSLIKFCYLRNMSLLFLNHASSIFVTKDVFVDQTTACTIAISLTHSKIDYCNSLLLNLPATQTNQLQLALNLNSAARSVTKTPKYKTLLPFLNLSTGSRQMRESNRRFSLSIFQNGPTFLPPLSSFIPFTSLYSVFLSYHP